MESLGSKLRWIAHAECGAAMNISQAISNLSLHTNELPVENCIHDKLRILIIKSRPCMIQYSVLLKTDTWRNQHIFLVISIYHQLSFLFNSNPSPAPPTSTTSAATNVRLLASLAGWNWSEIITNTSGWEEECCRPRFVLKKRLKLILKNYNQLLWRETLEGPRKLRQHKTSYLLIKNHILSSQRNTLVGLYEKHSWAIFKVNSRNPQTNAEQRMSFGNRYRRLRFKKT